MGGHGISTYTQLSTLFCNVSCNHFHSPSADRSKNNREDCRVLEEVSEDGIRKLSVTYELDGGFNLWTQGVSRYWFAVKADNAYCKSCVAPLATYLDCKALLTDEV
jgi:hypothetical protein